jgi:hypothetical protein
MRLAIIDQENAGIDIISDGEISNPVIENARPLELIDTRFALEPHTGAMKEETAVLETNATLFHI